LLFCAAGQSVFARNTGDALVADPAGKSYTKLYLGAMPVLSMRLFNTGGTDYDGQEAGGSYSAGGAFIAEFFLSEQFSLQTGVFYATDAMTVSGGKTYTAPKYKGYDYEEQ
jgi:hypothetical protein